jgi:putative aminopeptidase FrvX
MAKLFMQAGARRDQIRYQIVDSSRSKNVYVVKPGRTRSVIVVGGHIDHVTAGKGIIDNWTAICALTNIYQAIRHIRTNHTIVFIGFAKEEVGLVGSRAYVAQLSAKMRARHRAMFNMECLGVGEAHVWTNGSDEELIRPLHEVASREQIALHDHVLENVGADSNSFRDRDIPAITLDGLPIDQFSLIHSEKDVCENVNLNFYYDSYRLAVSYLLELDRSLGTGTVNDARTIR